MAKGQPHSMTVDGGPRGHGNKKEDEKTDDLPLADKKNNRTDGPGVKCVRTLMKTGGYQRYSNIRGKKPLRGPAEPRDI